MVNPDESFSLDLTSGLENIFIFLAAKSKNKNSLCKANITLPAYVDFRECMGPHINCD
jgi:hypothetical protein